MSTSSLVFQIQSFLILCVLGAGVFLRKRRKFHVPLMSVGILWDLILVLQIELLRDAIFKASRFMENFWLLNVHITLASTTLLFYGACVYTGRRLLANDFSVRKYHRWLGTTTIILRVLTFMTGLIYALV